MQISEANIQITRNGGKLSSISVSMPVWSKHADDGNLIVFLPMLGLETIAKDDNDAEQAIEEAIISFCIASERWGQGLDKELQALKWIPDKNFSRFSILIIFAETPAIPCHKNQNVGRSLM
jgi:hypothetical protein